MSRTFGLSAFVVALLLARQGYGVWAMMRSCEAVAVSLA